MCINNNKIKKTTKMETDLSKVCPADDNQELIAKKNEKIGPRYFLTISSTTTKGSIKMLLVQSP